MTLLSVIDVLEQVLSMPIRGGQPTGVGGMVEMVKSPAFATAVGLLKYGATRPAKVASAAAPARMTQTSSQNAQSPAPAVTLNESATPGIGTKFWGWLREVF